MRLLLVILGLVSYMSTGPVIAGDEEDRTYEACHRHSERSRRHCHTVSTRLMAIQREMVAQGYLNDEADGVMGPNTRRAIKRAQRALGLRATGRPTLNLLRALNSARAQGSEERAVAQTASARTARMGFDRNYAKAGGWSIGFNSERGHCLAGAQFNGGLVFFMGIDDIKKEGVIGFFNERWRDITAGNRYEIEYRFGRSQWNGPTTGATTRFGQGYFAEDIKPEFMEAIARSASMEIRRDNRRLDRLSLRGTRKALDATVQCQRDSREAAPTQQIAVDDSPAGQQGAQASAGAAQESNEDALQEAARLYNQGADAYNKRDFSLAEPLFQRALSILEAKLGQDHPSVAKTLHNLANLHEHQGRYAEAEPLYKRALAIREAKLGQDHPNVAASLNNLAGLYLSHGRYAEAEPLYKRALGIAEAKFGQDHPRVAASVNNLAQLYQAQGRYAEAEPLYKRALSIDEAKLGQDHPEVATSLNNLALLYDAQGRYAEAEPLYKRALGIFEAKLGQDHPEVAKTLSNLAELYDAQGRYAEAEPLYKRALSIDEAKLGQDHPVIITTPSRMAALHSRMAAFQLKQGRYAEAEPLYKRALSIYEAKLGKDHPAVATSLNDLAGLYSDQGRHAKAEPLYKRALAIYEAKLGQDHPEVAKTLNNLAELYDAQGRYAEAEPLYKRALGIFEAELGKDHPDVALSLNNLAGLYNAQGRYTEALPLLSKLNASQRGKPSVVLANLHGARSQGAISAEDAFAEAYKPLQYALSSAAANAVKKLALRYASGSEALAQLVRRDQDLEASLGAFDQNLVKQFSKPPEQRDASTEARLRAAIEEMKTERRALAARLESEFPDYVALSNPKPLTLSQTQALLDDDEAVVAFHIADKQSYVFVVTQDEGHWTRLPEANTSTVDALVARLRKPMEEGDTSTFDTAAAYALYQALLAPVANQLKGRKRLSILPHGALNSLPLAMLVTSEPTGKSLRAQDYLIKSHALTVIPSIYALQTMRAGQTVSAPKKMIAFADPVFGETASARVALRSLPSFVRGNDIDLKALGAAMPQLPGTRVEVERIAAKLKVPRSEVILGGAATETAVKSAALEQYRIVYFATHGLVTGELEAFAKSEAEPSLALTLPATPSALDNGLLSASEVALLNLNAEWAVLSACNTAAGDGAGAQALSGLARAFLYAGARSLVVSHWAVADEATAELMSALFEIADANPRLSHGEAMQQAMLRMLNKAGTSDTKDPQQVMLRMFDKAKTDEAAHPFYWAPFIVVGEGRAQR